VGGVDEELLSELGLEMLPAWEKDLLLAHIGETLEIRVGIRLASEWSDDQLDEFEALLQASDEEAASAWLETNVPDYRSIVAAELTRLKGELMTQSGAILEVSHSLTVVSGGRSGGRAGSFDGGR
jgi:uncharacterized protein DUF5663